MAKLKNIIKQLSVEDYTHIYDLLIESSADKSAYLLKSMREKSASDSKIMEELQVNTNAYYTLRSRLNQKIEEYLLQQMESPRTDLIKKVANISEIVFTKKRTISIATLKKLEKELLDYDLSNELTVIYKILKRLYRNNPEYYTYSQLYNKHVAFMLAVDKAEDILSDYFARFGDFALNGGENEKMSLELMLQEMDNVCNLYQSHRLYVYQSCLTIFHRLFIQKGDVEDDSKEPIEDILDKVFEIFDTYKMDSVYFHLRLVFDFLRLEYYDFYKLHRKAEEYFEDVNEKAALFLSNFGSYTYTPQFLVTKMARYIRLDDVSEIKSENESTFSEIEIDVNDLPLYLTYTAYNALSFYYADNYEDAAKVVNNFLNEVSLKKQPFAQLELKSILAVQYCLLKDSDLFNQLMNSIQRQIRIQGKESCEHIVILTKILKIAMSETRRNKKDKIRELADKFERMESEKIFAPTKLIRMSEAFITSLV